MYAEYRKNDIDAKLQRMKVHPLDIMVTGATGAGKSTTLNALFERYVAKVGESPAPETMDLKAYALSEVARFWDTPGVGDGVFNDMNHERRIRELLHKAYTIDGKDYGWIDLVLVILEGDSREMGSTFRLINNVIIPNFQSNRILIAINQADVAMKGRHWDKIYNKPDAVLENFLQEKVISVKKRIYESTGVDVISPVCYSGEYGYNIKKLMDLIIDNIPTERRPLIKL